MARVDHTVSCETTEIIDKGARGLCGFSCFSIWTVMSLREPGARQRLPRRADLIRNLRFHPER
jgi:hypothetical protein